ncbi:hypothetical protein [Sphingomonas cavernae]|uniref:hypothetical protein n=1 Tax=Sphingomonas cavernae TaxID=2320861 RepID=UPI001601F145|nr:hypothetical protein [Sphingomonas cavernae]
MGIRKYLCGVLGHMRSRERAFSDQRGRWISECVHCTTRLHRCHDRKWRPLSETE